MTGTALMMTHAQANEEVAAWQNQLQKASEELASFDIGRYALEFGVDKGLQQKARLAAEVDRCTAGLAVAQSQAKAVQRAEQVANAAAEEKEAIELEAKGAAIHSRMEELRSELVPLQEQFAYIAHRVDLLRTHAEQLRRTYGGTS